MGSRARWRTWLAGALAAALVATMMTACSDPPILRGSGAVDCPLEALEEAEGPVEVTLWYGGLGGPTREVLLGLAEEFNASQDQVVVTPSDQGQSFEEVYRKFTSTASTPNDLPQLVMVEDTTMQAMVDSGLVLPAQSCMEADGYDLNNINPVVRANYTVDGSLYPGFSTLTSQILYYNKAHWARAGLDPEDPPQTLDELYDQAVALKEAGVSNRPLSLKVGHSFFKNWLTGVGVDMVNHRNGRECLATEATFDTGEGRELVEFFQRMNDEGLLNVFSATEGSIDHYLALVQQQSSMLIETSTASTTFAEVLSGELTAEDAGVDFDADAVDTAALVPGAGPFPGIEEPGRVVPGGGVFYIVNSSDPAQQAGAWKFLEHMLRPESSTRWHVEGGYLPIVEGVGDQESVQRFWREDLAGLLLSQAVRQLDEADPEQPGPLIGPYTEFTDDLENAVESALIGGSDADSALSDAEERFTGELLRYAGVDEAEIEENEAAVLADLGCDGDTS
jgi:sn-glycerol 3-phosphate transport system substrate-binding protein